MDAAMKHVTGPVEISIPAGEVSLDAALCMPPLPRGLVLFAHGSGSSRHSPRNGEVAAALNRAGIATLLLDLLARDEASGYEKRFDIALQARRLSLATVWTGTRPEFAAMPVGYFGVNTGAAAAFVASVRGDGRVVAIVSRGGRPDLAGSGTIGAVTAPTLLLVGGRDAPVLAINRACVAGLHCEHSLVVVPGANHLFEEPGTLDEAAKLATEWFLRWFAVAAAEGSPAPAA
jgi:putative phosphoribosyl transferase